MLKPIQKTDTDDTYLVGGVEDLFFFHILGIINPNWLICFRGVETINQYCWTIGWWLMEFVLFVMLLMEQDKSKKMMWTQCHKPSHPPTMTGIILHPNKLYIGVSPIINLYWRWFIIVFTTWGFICCCNVSKISKVTMWDLGGRSGDFSTSTAASFWIQCLKYPLVSSNMACGKFTIYRWCAHLKNHLYSFSWIFQAAMFHFG